MRVLTMLIALLLSPGLAFAQSGDAESLAEIRAELVALAAQIEGLRAELVGPEAVSQPAVPDTTPMFLRLEVLEAELRRLTGSLETLQNDISLIVAEASNKLGDLEYRLVELEGGDTSALGTAPQLGGVTGNDAPQMAMGEQADFDAALAAHQAGDYARAVELFAAFSATYPGGPLTSDAAFWRGEALAAQGDWNNAARSYLDSFSGATNGPRAPQALYRLGVSLGKLGQLEAACQTLGEVPRRYPALAPDMAAQVRAEQQGLACPS